MTLARACNECDHSHGQCPQPGVIADEWFVVPINPLPWAVGPLSVGRGRGNKWYPKMGANQELVAYQEAIRHHFKTMIAEGGWGAPVPTEGKYQLEFFYWRQREEYTTAKGRDARRHEADVTNLNKATEDALQGVLIGNDRDCVEVTGFMVSQTPDTRPKLLIHLVVKDAVILDPTRIPEHIWDELDFVDASTDNLLAPPEESDPDEIPF